MIGARSTQPTGPFAMPRPARSVACCCALALITLLAATMVSAEETKPKSSGTGKGKAAQPEKPVFLWEVRSPSATVYLLGSIHIASGDMYPLDARIEHAFQAADTLVLETDLDEPSQARAAALLQQAGTYTPPDSLESHIDAATLAALSQSIASMGLPVEAFFSMRPWMVSLTLTLARLQALGYRPDLGIDQHFRGAAGAKKLAALETVDQQVALFGDMTESLQNAALRQTIEELGTLRDIMQRAFGAWRTGDALGLEALLVAPTRKDYPELYRRLFVERNRRMADAVETYLKGKGTIFVVVGSGHLVGSDSVLHLLQTHGHKTKQL
jgi:uncharacterized protein YbaP (TraB family)